jgi:hypothetical protein
LAGRRIYEGGTRVLSWILICLGVAQIVFGVLRGVAPLVYVVAVVFIALGAARLWLARARGD